MIDHWVIIGYVAFLQGGSHPNRPRDWSLTKLKNLDDTTCHRMVISTKLPVVILWYCGWKKSCTTLDGWNPINNGINHLSTGAGFLPSTVSQVISCDSMTLSYPKELRLCPSIVGNMIPRRMSSTFFNLGSDRVTGVASTLEPQMGCIVLNIALLKNGILNGLPLFSPWWPQKLRVFIACFWMIPCNLLNTIAIPISV